MKNLILILTFILSVSFAESAPYRYRHDDESQIALKEIKDGLDNTRNEINNHETELRMFQERINNQESTISSLRQHVLDSTQGSKELLKSTIGSVEGKLNSYDSNLKAFIADLNQLKTHSNETATGLAQCKQKLAEIDKMLSKQSQNIENLQIALRSLTDALQVKESITSNSEKSYKVKNGDSLEKIARAHQTTIKALKELNQLTSDKIIVGQTLQIP